MNKTHPKDSQKQYLPIVIIYICWYTMLFLLAYNARDAGMLFSSYDINLMIVN